MDIDIHKYVCLHIYVIIEACCYTALAKGCCLVEGNHVMELKYTLNGVNDILTSLPMHVTHIRIQHIQ